MDAADVSIVSPFVLVPELRAQASGDPHSNFWFRCARHRSVQSATTSTFERTDVRGPIVEFGNSLKKLNVLLVFGLL